MTHATPVDPAAVKTAAKSGFQYLARTMLSGVKRKKARGKIKTVPNAAAVTAFAEGVVSSVLAGRASVGVDEETEKRIAEAKLALEVNMQFMTGMLAQCEALGTAYGHLANSALEFMARTGHGQAAADAFDTLQEHIQRGFTMENVLRSHLVKVQLLRTDAEFGQIDKLVQEDMRTLIEDTRKWTDKAARMTTEAIRFETVKALIVQDPETDSTVVEGLFWAIDQGLNVMQFGGGLFGVIPSPYTTAMSLALGNASRALKLGMGMLKRQVQAGEAATAVKKYQDTHENDAAFVEHDKNPLLMAEMLNEKQRKDMEIILLGADVLVGPATDFWTPAGSIWTGCRKAVEIANDKYLDERITRLKAQMGLAPDATGATVGDKAKQVGKEMLKDFGSAMLNSLKSDITSALNPLNLAAWAVYETLGNQLAEFILSKLPIDPAQKVDGAQLLAHANEIADSLFANMPPVAPPAPKPTVAADRPAADDQGNPVDQYLSGVQGPDGGRFRYAKVGGETGKLYLDTRVFEPGPMDAVSEAMKAFVPATDAKGRKVLEIDLETAYTAGMPGTEGASFKGQPVRVAAGGYWGFVDTVSPHPFWPTDVLPEMFEDWKDRTIKPAGYLETGQLVTGKWYQPFKQHASYYLFAGDDGMFRWAKKQNATKGGRGSEFTIANLVKVKGDFDLGLL
jgi:hypothetical protein